MDLTKCVEHHGGISVIRGGQSVRSWNGIEYHAGLSAKNVNVKQLSMNIATVPPGGVASAHVHVGFEVMLYILQGSVRHEFGDRLRQSVDNGAGDFIYIEPGVPHEVFNLSDTEPVVAVVARSDADEWSHIVVYRSRHRSDGRRCPADEVVRTHAWSSLKSPSARGQAGRGERRPDSSASASRMKWRHYGRTDPSVAKRVAR